MGAELLLGLIPSVITGAYHPLRHPYCIGYSNEPSRWSTETNIDTPNIECSHLLTLKTKITEKNQEILITLHYDIPMDLSITYDMCNGFPIMFDTRCGLLGDDD